MRLALIAATLLATVATAQTNDNEKPNPGFNEPTFKGLALRTIGPALMSGRIADIAISPTDQSTWYVGVGSGGVWKTVNAGTTWQPVFDNEDAYSIGAITVDSNNSDTVWVGTGIHKSEDGGGTWRELDECLPEETVGKVGLAVSPVDPNVVYATIELASRKGGFWRSLNGGESWEKRSECLSSGTGPHYYQEIFSSPHKQERVYQMDVPTHLIQCQTGGSPNSVSFWI